MTPILITCTFGYWYSLCLLENGSTYTAVRDKEDEKRLEVFVDWELYQVIYNGKEV